MVRVAGWTVVAAAGGVSVAVLAWSRGESVSALWMVVAAACVFAIAYRFHSAWLMARVLTLDQLGRRRPRCTPTASDFVRTNRWVVFGHHFAAIAGPGPLVGPVLAAQFGYLPGLLWILIGAVFGGAVHDSIILFCSVRRGGRSMGQMVRDEVGPFAGLVALVSITAISVILLAVLGLVVVNALAESPWGVFTIAATMPIAVAMGVALRSGGHESARLRWTTAAGVVCPARRGLGRPVHRGNVPGGAAHPAGDDPRLVDHGLRIRRIRRAGLAPSRPARLPEHLHEDRDDRRPGRSRSSS